MATGMKPLTVSLPAVTVARLKVIAAARDRTMSDLVSEVLGGYVSEHVDGAMKLVAADG